jgi:hypothetical protein
MEPELVVVTVDWAVDDYQMKGMPEQVVTTDLQNFSAPEEKKGHDRLEAAYLTGGQKAYWETRIYLLAGDNNKALENLNRAFDGGCFWPTMRTEPIFDPLRGDPRYTELLKRIKLSE